MVICIYRRNIIMKLSIKNKLDEKNISRYELAKRIGVTYPTIDKIYKGESTAIKFEILQELVKFLIVPQMTYLFLIRMVLNEYHPFFVLHNSHFIRHINRSLIFIHIICEHTNNFSKIIGL